MSSSAFMVEAQIPRGYPITLIEHLCSLHYFTPGKNLASWLTKKVAVANICFVLSMPSDADTHLYTFLDRLTEGLCWVSA